jgi:hypothetical protein
MGAPNLSGSDSILVAAARLRADTKVHVLPVVVQFGATRWEDEPPQDSDDGSYEDTIVYPSTEAHPDTAPARSASDAERRVEWLNGVEDVPFYALNFDQATIKWSEEKERGGFTGNEAAPSREDSIYLSYAQLALPKGDSDSRIAP